MFQSDHPAGYSRARLGRVAAAAIAALVASVACAQQLPEAPVYRIQPGDGLEIVVANHEEWSLNVTVRPDGRITYPATGEIEVGGLTVQELTDRLEAALGPVGHHLRDPQVLINVAVAHAATAHVLGAVPRPGPIEMPRGISTVREVVTMAGGLTEEADASRATLYRRDGRGLALDLQAQLTGEAPEVVVNPGDVIMVPTLELHHVGVLGAVGRTGEVELPPGENSINVLSLLVLVGGLSQSADPNRAVILRGDGDVEGVALSKVLERSIEAPVLDEGDVLWVPPLPEDEFFAVTGAVATAGRFDYREGISLADALALAGTLDETADPQRVTIIHADGEKEVVDVLPMLRGEQTEVARKPILPDDIILVPSRHKSYAILGAVGNPGFYLWDEETYLADALTEAGGMSEADADAAHVILVRRGERGEEPTVMELNARQLLQGRNEAANWRLMPGDTVYVPGRGDDDWRDDLSLPIWILSVFGSLRSVFNW